MTQTLTTFWSEVQYKLIRNLELAPDAKLALSLTTMRKYWDLSDPSRLLITSTRLLHNLDLVQKDTESSIGIFFN